ncbi:hypothetical protein LIER_33683 [Lithospermum erythrorhizon]|uniref:Uncharacterized protein n=1 Tax=Lithospermum erythrorhizon TaxID=34254 RepID=A0AAV3S0T9_LITER
MARPRKGSSSRREFQRVWDREDDEFASFPYHVKFYPFSLLQAATAAQALTEYGDTKEDKEDRLEAALVREDSRVYRLRESVKESGAQLSLAYQELRRLAIHPQQVVEAREEKEQVPSLPSLLEAYKQRFPRGELEVVPSFLLPTPSKPLDGSK